MHLFKCNLKKVEEEVTKLNLRVKQLETHIEELNKQYFIHHVDRKYTKEDEKKCGCDNDLEWGLKFYNYE